MEKQCTTKVSLLRNGFGSFLSSNIMMHVSCSCIVSITIITWSSCSTICSRWPCHAWWSVRQIAPFDAPHVHEVSLELELALEFALALDFGTLSNTLTLADHQYEGDRLSTRMAVRKFGTSGRREWTGLNIVEWYWLTQRQQSGWSMMRSQKK